MPRARRCLGVRIVLALVALAVTAPAAPAAAPMRGQTYEGPGPKGGSDVILVVSGNGARVQRLTFGYERGCRVAGERLRQQGTVYVTKARIRNGRFSWRRSERYPATGGSMSMTVKGRFVDGGTRVVGTVRETTINPQNKVRCNSGRVKFSAAVAERELVNGKWAGSTGQNRPLTMTITPKGIEAIAVEVALTCTNGEQIVRAIAPLAQPASVDDDDLTFTAGTWTGDTQISVKGTASRNQVSGTITATDAITRPEGPDDERTYSCSSGEVTFQARRA